MDWKPNAIGRIAFPLASFAVASTLALAHPALAQDRQSQRSTSSRAQSAQVRQVSGEVIAKKQVNVPAQFHNVSVVMIRTNDGRRAIIDLGSAMDPQLRKANVQVGDTIAARGTPLKMGNRLVLEANQLRVDGQTFRIDRQAQMRQAMSRSHRDGGRMRQVTGWVTAMGEYDIQGSEQPLTIVKLRTGDGQEAYVSLGREEQGQRNEPNVSLGERIAARGVLSRLGNTLVLVPTQIRADGQTYQIARRQEAQQPRRSARLQRQASNDRQIARSRDPGVKAYNADAAFISKENIMEVERTLKDQGYDPGRVDGRMTEQTRTALKRFQDVRNVQETGVLDRATIDQLEIAGAHFTGQLGAMHDGEDDRVTPGGYIP